MLEAHGLASGYDRITVIEDIDLRIADGEWIASSARSGPGIDPDAHARRSLEAKAGRILLDGADVTTLPSYRRVTRGLSLVPEGAPALPRHDEPRRTCSRARSRRSAPRSLPASSTCTACSPILAERHGQQVGTLSGGEQQMCAIGRALMSRPKLLLVDAALPRAGAGRRRRPARCARCDPRRGNGAARRRAGRGDLAVPRRPRLRHAPRRIVTEGPSAALLADPALTSEFLGVGT